MSETKPGGTEVRKNPFAPRESTTVRRGKDEVYPHRKGLNRPEFVGETPLDLLFQELESALDGSLESVTVESLAPKLFPTEKVDISPSTDLRYRVVERLLAYLIQVQEYAVEASKNAPQKDLIVISLHDIKTFGKLVNLIILLGIYPATSAFGIGVPIEKRRLNSFGKSSYKALKIQPLEISKGSGEKYSAHYALLRLIYERLEHVFSTDSDARNLLLKGSGYSDFLVVAIALATVPHFDESAREKMRRKYDELTQIATTYELYQDYSLLLATPSPAYFKAFVMEKLQLLPACAPKDDGVLTLIEFVLGLRDSDEINVEKLDHVASVLLSKPKTLSSTIYFTSIGNQCYEILVNINQPTIAMCVCHFIEKLWMKNTRIVADFFLRRIWENFDPSAENKRFGKVNNAEKANNAERAENLEKSEKSEKVVLVSERDLNNNVNVLLSLSNRGLPNDLLSALFTPILVPFWSYYCFLRQNGKPAEIAQNILVSFFTQLSVNEKSARLQLSRICEALVAEQEWKFRIGANGLVEIFSSDSSTVQRTDPEQKVLHFMTSLDQNCASFLALSEQLDDVLIKDVFVTLLSKWVGASPTADASLEENPFLKLVDLRLLENIGNKFKDRLAQTPYDILVLVDRVLGRRKESQSAKFTEISDQEADSDDEDEDSDESSEETLTVVLELLSAIISETQPAELDEKCRKLLTSIQNKLSSDYPELKTGQALVARISMLLDEDKEALNTDLELEKRTFARAIANLNDPLVPIRAHGLYLLRQLVEQGSSVISVDFAVSLHLIQLKDSDPFVYLNAIKGLDSLLGLDAGRVLPVLTSIYCGSGEQSKENEAVLKGSNEIEQPHDSQNTKPISEADLDERLRVGEVLLRYIQAQDEAFSGSLASLVCKSALGLIRRPEKGEENIDDRLRMSAMSILGTCCNTNVLGIMEHIGDAVDCAIGVLQLESGKDQAIMRRSAIVLLYDLVSGTSKSDSVPFPRHYMEKVLTIFKYVQSHDLDLLVREQATSVLDYIDELVKAAVA